MIHQGTTTRTTRGGAPSRTASLEALEPRRLLAASPANLPLTSDPGVQQMPSVAVDPIAPQHLVTAYMDRSLVATGYAGIGVAVSTDAGKTWTRSVVPVPAG